MYRVIEVDAQTGAARAVISEEPKTFFYYNRCAATLQAGKRYRYDLADGKEVVWMSERDGWNHLYLIDGATGAVKNQITKGAWPVRHVIKVDEEKRQLWFSAGGMNAGKDPYFQHYYRINLDGTGLTPLTIGRRQSHRRVLVRHDVLSSTTIRASISPSVSSSLTIVADGDG